MESRYERLLKEKLDIMNDMVVQGMTVGSGYSDFPEYKYNLGYLAAIRAVVEAMEQTRDDMGKE